MKEKTPVAEERRSLRERLLAMFRPSQAEDMSDQDVRSALDAALFADVPGFLGIDAVYQGYVIYAAAPMNQEMPWDQAAIQLYSRDYTMGSDGKVILSGQGTEVKQVVSYEPVTPPASTPAAGATPAAATAAAAGCGCGGKAPNQTAGEAKMADKTRTAAAPADGGREGGRSARIQAIIDRLNTVAPGFLGNDAAEELAEWSDDALGDLESLASSLEAKPPQEPAGEQDTPPAAPPQQTSDKKPDMPTNMAASVNGAATRKGGDVAKPKTVEEYLAEAPEEIREVFASHQEQQKKRKAALVGGLKDAQKSYTEEELNAMPIKELEKLEAIVAANKPKRDFGGNGAPRSQQTEDDKTPPPPPSMRERILAARGITPKQQAS